MAKLETKAKAPAPPAPPSRPTKTRRRPAMIGLGIALTAVGVFGAITLTSSLGHTTQVISLRAEVARGHEITAEDLITVEIPTGPTTLRSIPADKLSSVTGSYARVDLLAGSLLTPDSFVDAITPAAGTSIVGISLSANQMPTQSLRAGDQVRIVQTPPAQGEPPIEAPVTIGATVLSVEPSKSSDSVIVNVEVSSASAADLAARASTGRVALVLDSLEQ